MKLPLGKKHLFKFLGLWPPFLGAGIRVRSVSPDLRKIEAELGMFPWNRNYVGTQFGGSLYALTDPFYMLMLIENLGKDYVVWDKAATIRFKRPGKGKVTARFELTEERLAEIRKQLETSEKIEPVFRVEVKDDSGQTVAEVEKLLYIRKKRA